MPKTVMPISIAPTRRSRRPASPPIRPRFHSLKTDKMLAFAILPMLLACADELIETLPLL